MSGFIMIGRLKTLTILLWVFLRIEPSRQIGSNFCTSSPCKNGGSCIGNNETAYCYCGPEWTGKNCEDKTKTSFCSEKSSPVDLLFIVDGSYSVRNDSFQKALDFIVRMIDRLYVDNSRAAVIVYSGTARTELSFSTSAKMGKEGTKSVIITQIRYHGGLTKTGEAISQAVALFKLDGRLNSNVMSVAFVITDGKSQDDVSFPAREAQRLGITVFAIGVGNSVDFDELRDIAIHNSRIYKVDDHAMLGSIEDKLHEKICEDHIGIHVLCTNDPSGFPVMEVFIHKSLQKSRVITVGSCSSFSLFDGAQILSGNKNNTSNYWYLNITENMCGTIMNSTKDYVSFNNYIKLSQDTSAKKSIIIRDYASRVNWGLRCMYRSMINITSQFQTGIDDEMFRIKSLMYKSSQFVSELSAPFIYYEGETVFVELQVISYHNLQTLLLNCSVTHNPDEINQMTYKLIDNGCQEQERFQSYSNYGIKSKVRFSFEILNSVNALDQVFLKCQMAICYSGNQNTRCSRGCQNSTSQATRHLDQLGSIVQEYSIEPLIVVRKEKNECNGEQCGCPYGEEPLPSDPNICQKSLKLEGSVKIEENFNEELNDPNSESYQDLERKALVVLKEASRKLAPDVETDIKITGFTQGSIVVHFITTIFSVNQDPLDEARVENLQRTFARNVQTYNGSSLGLSKDPDAVQLSDKNECAQPEDNDCSIYADCVNTIGAFECRCWEGYKDLTGFLTGKECGFEKREAEENNILLWISIGVGILGVVIIGAIVGAVVWFKKSKSEKSEIESMNSFEGKQNDAMEEPVYETLSESGYEDFIKPGYEDFIKPVYKPAYEVYNNRY